ncbi:hypothetical protein NLG97_g1847 [Lecanicillium saksenae]|uniref:Uncharacterized protein n=1 Tax=Lecanicillium saksenae TaxID=468837 RepID=A0ACC1R2M3_9HYPO|nr:hypothetical protein NLG97_g1847 [Lecanicillium saksenae]
MRSFALAAAAALLPSVLAAPGNLSAISNSVLFQRDEGDENYNSIDLSFIKRLAAIGDSYSAGIGAGDFLNGEGDFACSRYDHAYPNIMNNDLRLGDPGGRNFQFVSCSGAVISDLLKKQIPNLLENQDVILLSAGGNDAKLVDLLNQCVYQWSTFEWDDVDAPKHDELKRDFPDMDWEKFGVGCGNQMKASMDIIMSERFSTDLDVLIETAKRKLSANGIIYYTGYAKFFDTRLDPACDDVSWAIWTDKVPKLKEAKLTAENRKMMNTLVEKMNEQLEKAVKRAGPQVQFVNYDDYVGMLGGRYCMPGVDEAASDSNTRSALTLYAAFGPWKRSDINYPPGTFEGDMSQYAKIMLKLMPDNKLKLSHKVESDSDIGKKSLSDHLPDGLRRIFHPQIKLHQLISNLIIWRLTERQREAEGWDPIPEMWSQLPPACPIDKPEQPGDPGTDPNEPIGEVVLYYKNTPPGRQVAKDTELRILPVGDSITVGFGSGWQGNGDGYRRQLKMDLSADTVDFAGTESGGTMMGGYYAAWGGRTIQYISDHVDPSLDQQPNIVLLAAGTNDMNPDGSISTEGNDPAAAAERLGKLIDKIVEKCPDATVLVAIIIGTCQPSQSPQTKKFQSLIPDVVRKRREKRKHVLAVDFSSFGDWNLRDDCIHPSDSGYRIMGHYWYDFITQIPRDWIKRPLGYEDHRGANAFANGGIDRDIPAPDWGTSPIQKTSAQAIKDAFESAHPVVNNFGKEPRQYPECSAKPSWAKTGEIALGLGKNGNWQYHKYWVAAGTVASGLGLDNSGVRLHDMNGDGKADYIWVSPQNGEIHCWINNLPEPWTPAGTNTGAMKGVIGSGVDQGKKVYLADMNGDGMDDYLVVDPDNGSVRVWWNYGPDANWANGWKFVAGGEIASGVKHANLATLRFPDINGDGRADYVYIGKGGSLKHWLNMGTTGGQDVLFHAQGGIATGAEDDFTKIVFADINGDGRDDYLIWDGEGGLTGYLNQRTNAEGVPLYINQGPAKTIADGIGKPPATIRLADMDGDGKDDYVHVGAEGALSVWYNHGTIDDSMGIDGLRFARFNHDHTADYVWLDPATGAPYYARNDKIDSSDVLGWRWTAMNGGKPIAAGATAAKNVRFGDIDGDGYDDYLTLDPVTGELKAYLWVRHYDGSDGKEFGDFRFRPIGSIATGLGPGKDVRIADIDGDGRDDYILLNKQGGTTIFRNVYGEWSGPSDRFRAMPEADASGIGRPPSEISFHDINGDGKADYVWTRPLDGGVEVWLNMYPAHPTWHSIGEVLPGTGTSGHNVRFAQLADKGEHGREDYIAVDPSTGALAAWLNGCSALASPSRHYRMSFTYSFNPKNVGSGGSVSGGTWTAWENIGPDPDMPDYCHIKPAYVSEPGVEFGQTVPEIGAFKIFGHKCLYRGAQPGDGDSFIGRLVCEGLTGIRCYVPKFQGKPAYCEETKLKHQVMLQCEWN